MNLVIYLKMACIVKYTEKQSAHSEVLQSCQSLSTCDLRTHLTPVIGPLTSNSASTELAVIRGDSFIGYNSSSDKARKKWQFN